MGTTTSTPRASHRSTTSTGASVSAPSVTADVDRVEELLRHLAQADMQFIRTCYRRAVGVFSDSEGFWTRGQTRGNGRRDGKPAVSSTAHRSQLLSVLISDGAHDGFLLERGPEARSGFPSAASHGVSRERAPSSGARNRTLWPELEAVPSPVPASTSNAGHDLAGEADAKAAVALNSLSRAQFSHIFTIPTLVAAPRDASGNLVTWKDSAPRLQQVALPMAVFDTLAARKSFLPTINRREEGGARTSAPTAADLHYLIPRSNLNLMQMTPRRHGPHHMGKPLFSPLAARCASTRTVAGTGMHGGVSGSNPSLAPLREDVSVYTGRSGVSSSSDTAPGHVTAPSATPSSQARAVMPAGIARAPDNSRKLTGTRVTTEQHSPERSHTSASDTAGGGGGVSSPQRHAPRATSSHHDASLSGLAAHHLTSSASAGAASTTRKAASNGRKAARVRRVRKLKLGAEDDLDSLAMEAALNRVERTLLIKSGAFGVEQVERVPLPPMAAYNLGLCVDKPAAAARSGKGGRVSGLRGSTSTPTLPNAASFVSTMHPSASASALSPTRPGNSEAPPTGSSEAPAMSLRDVKRRGGLAASGKTSPATGTADPKKNPTWEGLISNAKAFVHAGELFTLLALQGKGEIDDKAGFLFDMYSALDIQDSDPDLNPYSFSDAPFRLPAPATATAKFCADRSALAPIDRRLTDSGLRQLLLACCSAWHRIHELPFFPGRLIISSCLDQIEADIANFETQVQASPARAGVSRQVRKPASHRVPTSPLVPAVVSATSIRAAVDAPLPGSKHGGDLDTVVDTVVAVATDDIFFGEPDDAFTGIREDLMTPESDMGGQRGTGPSRPASGYNTRTGLGSLTSSGGSAPLGISRHAFLAWASHCAGTNYGVKIVEAFTATVAAAQAPFLTEEHLGSHHGRGTRRCPSPSPSVSSAPRTTPARAAGTGSAIRSTGGSSVGFASGDHSGTTASVGLMETPPPPSPIRPIMSRSLEALDLHQDTSARAHGYRASVSYVLPDSSWHHDVVPQPAATPATRASTHTVGSDAASPLDSSHPTGLRACASMPHIPRLMTQTHMTQAHIDQLGAAGVQRGISVDRPSDHVASSSNVATSRSLTHGAPQAASNDSTVAASGDFKLPAATTQLLSTPISHLLLSIHMYGGTQGFVGLLRATFAIQQIRVFSGRAHVMGSQAAKDSRTAQHIRAPAALHASPFPGGLRVGDANSVAAASGVSLENLWVRLLLAAQSPWQASKVAALPAGITSALSTGPLVTTMHLARVALLTNGTMQSMTPGAGGYSLLFPLPVGSGGDGARGGSESVGARAAAKRKPQAEISLFGSLDFSSRKRQQLKAAPSASSPGKGGAGRLPDRHKHAVSYGSRRRSIEDGSDNATRAERQFASMAQHLEQACEFLEKAELIHRNQVLVSVDDEDLTPRRKAALKAHLRRKLQRTILKAAAAARVLAVLGSATSVQHNRKLRAVADMIDTVMTKPGLDETATTTPVRRRSVQVTHHGEGSLSGRLTSTSHTSVQGSQDPISEVPSPPSGSGERHLTASLSAQHPDATANNTASSYASVPVAFASAAHTIPLTSRLSPPPSTIRSGESSHPLKHVPALGYARLASDGRAYIPTGVIPARAEAGAESLLPLRRTFTSPQYTNTADTAHAGGTSGTLRLAPLHSPMVASLPREPGGGVGLLRTGGGSSARNALAAVGKPLAGGKLTPLTVISTTSGSKSVAVSSVITAPKAQVPTLSEVASARKVTHLSRRADVTHNLNLLMSPVIMK